MARPSVRRTSARSGRRRGRTGRRSTERCQPAGGRTFVGTGEPSRRRARPVAPASHDLPLAHSASTCMYTVELSVSMCVYVFYVVYFTAM